MSRFSRHKQTFTDSAKFTKDVTLYSTLAVTGASTTSYDVGAKNGSTVTATEYGNGVVHKTVLTFTATQITIDNDAGSGAQCGGVKVYDFPQGRLIFLGATGSATFTTTSVLADTLNASKSCRWGIGTTIAANSTLATTEQDLLNVTTFTSSATINVASAASNAVGTGSLTAFDGTTTAVDAYLNLSVPTDGDLDADATVTVTGTATITWINLGDY